MKRIRFVDSMDKPTLEPEELAKYHNVPLSVIKQELEMGIAEESKEHTSNKSLAMEIALDHLYEDPRYYSKLRTK